MIYLTIALVFVLGYIAIAFEHNIHVDKAASALLTAIIIWTLMVIGGDGLLGKQIAEHFAGAQAMGEQVSHGTSAFLNAELRHHLAEIAEILFFLMGAMVIVELIDAHDGFYAITNRIRTTSAVNLLWTIGILTFFFSALLDNLTTTIVMVSLLRKLVSSREMRWWFAGIVVVCANAGGAWSPIGDVTTTMLWIGNQITANKIVVSLLIPSLVAALVPLIVLSFGLKGKKVRRPVAAVANASDMVSTAAIQVPKTNPEPTSNPPDPVSSSHSGAGVASSANIEKDDINVYPISKKLRTGILALGLGALAFVPIFKTVTHLPPYMGILFGVGVLWVVTERIHRHQDPYIKSQVTIVGVLKRVDIASILFFLGILLAVSGLATAGHLADMAGWLDNTFGNLYVINVMIGLLSSLVDNVPLVAGAMQMYPLADEASLVGLSGTDLARQSQFLQDGQFWHFLAYCAGTGGSCLIIGSAAGVAAMGMERIPFMWYLKRISGLALLGYIAGAITYILIHVL